jgi:hypothetical protein
MGFLPNCVEGIKGFYDIFINKFCEILEGEPIRVRQVGLVRGGWVQQL